MLLIVMNHDKLLWAKAFTLDLTCNILVLIVDIVMYFEVLNDIELARG